MHRIIAALALLGALASSAMAARLVCVAADVEGIPARICPPARRR